MQHCIETPFYFRWYPQFFWPLELIQWDQSAQLWRNARSIFISHAPVRNLQQPALTRPLGKQLCDTLEAQPLENSVFPAWPCEVDVASQLFARAAVREHSGPLSPKYLSGYYQWRALTFPAFDLLFSAGLSSAGEASQGVCRCPPPLITHHPPQTQ